MPSFGFVSGAEAFPSCPVLGGFSVAPLRQIQIIQLTLAVPLLAQIPRCFPYISITYMSACGPVWLRFTVHLPSVVLPCYWVASVFVVAAVRDVARCVEDYGLPAPSTSLTSRHCTSCIPIISTFACVGNITPLSTQSPLQSPHYHLFLQPRTSSPFTSPS